MRPVDRSYCSFDRVKDGSYDLIDFADMNDAIDVRDENERREIEHRRRAQGRT